MEKLKVAAVVVTFNRKQLLLECLNALRRQTYQLDAIFIIDGPSTDGTQDLLLKEGYINKSLPKEYHEYCWENRTGMLSATGERIEIYYFRIYEDIGGSGGFYEGVKRAYEKGYDWIWMMDDDVEPKENTLTELAKYIDLPDAVALAPIVREINGNISYHHRGFLSFENIFQTSLNEEEYGRKEPFQIDFVSFVGPLVHIGGKKFIGYPRKEFFIHFDDFEYSVRLREAGKIYLVPSSSIIHKEEFKINSLTTEKTLFGRKFPRIEYSKLWKTYYMKRNGTYIGKKYIKNKLKFSLQLVKLYFVSLGAIVLLDNHKFRRTWFLTSAFLDGLKDNFDNQKPKRILYGSEIK